MVTFEKNEHIILEVRKHWFVLATEIFWATVAIFIPLIVYAVGTALPITITMPGNNIIFFLFLYVFWLLIGWVTMFFFWTDYYLDVWIITNKRLIDVEQKGLFSRNIATMPISRIQDVTSEISGIIPTLIGFGNIHVQTAGQEREFVIKKVANPNETRQKLQAVLDAADASS